VNPVEEEIEFGTVTPRSDERGAAELKAFLAASGLDMEADIQVFVTGRLEGRLVACAGLAEGVVKCVAIEAEQRGTSLALRLMNELLQLALERGHAHLFLYTKPSNVALFRGCGFHPLVEVPGQACLMENTPVGIRTYCERLHALRQPGERIGSAVLNANPFTLGHLHLVRQALRECDWLHVFVVAEDASAIAYADRLDLVRQGLAGMEGLTVHDGSRYLISKATFPSYFIKDACAVEDCSTAMDLLMFRKHLAPALGITHRFVGPEPFCPITRKYNEDMHRWLENPLGEGPAIRAVEMPRCEVGGRPVSASEVRRLLARGDFEAMASLVPKTTLARLRAKYAP
jgi:[citrate (pro-3S)-lyase] ligase